MSHLRRIRVKKPIPKPAPFQLDASVFCCETTIRDRKLLERALEKLGYHSIGGGQVIGNTESVLTDLRVSADLGFCVDKFTGKLTAYVTERGKRRLDTISAIITQVECIENLEQEGYSVSKEYEEDGKWVIVMQAETDDEIREVEVIAETNGEMQIHSKNLSDAQACKAIIETATKGAEIESVIREEKTFEYGKPSKSKQNKKENKDSHWRGREHKKYRDR